MISNTRDRYFSHICTYSIYFIKQSINTWTAKRLLTESDHNTLYKADAEDARPADDNATALVDTLLI